jgi:hypothetical protein
MTLGPWRSLPPEGAEFYCWYHEPGMTEPDLYYIGLVGRDARGEGQRGAWTPRGDLPPIPVLGMPGLWRHPAVAIPLDFP